MPSHKPPGAKGLPQGSSKLNAPPLLANLPAPGDFYTFCHMKKVSFFLLVFSLLAYLGFFPGCGTSPKKDLLKPPRAKAPGEVSLMAYNLENLFDTERDLRTSDYTHLPLALKRKDPAIIAGCNAIKNDFYRKACLELDWNESTLKKKMNNLARVILSVDEGRGPDILFVEEVENEAILKRFNAEYLKAAGYITVFAPEGFDDRGIDVGLLSRFPIQGKPTLHKIPFKLNSEEETRRASDTRGILEVPLQLPDGSVGYFFTVHLPSQSNPHEQRRQAVEFIVGLLKDRSAKGLAVVAGDFNITADEDDRTGLYSKTLSSVGKVSHLVGCQHCRGTHYYKGSWSFLDAIVVAESGGWQMLPDTVWVVRALKEQLYHDIKPNRFDETTGEGMSDHLPIYARIGKKTN